MKRLLFLGAALAGLLPTVAPGAETAGGLTPTRLRCDYDVDPFGIDVAQPRLFWQVESSERGQRQTAWQILVASSAAMLAEDRGELWDSGRVDSEQTVQVPYSGKPLTSAQQVYWKVRAWDRDGKPSAWSAPATWTMGLLGPAAWRGQWIAAPGATETLLLRREFDVKPGLRRALAYVCGLGQYTMSLNGAKVGEDLFSPGWTDYDRTALYDTHDVTAQLRAGRNAIGLTLGNGMYSVVRRNRFAKFTRSFGPLRAILHLQLEYVDGTTECIGTSSDWRAHAGPQTYASIYGGEDFDARLVPHGWDRPAFDDRAWLPAVPVILLSNVLRGHSAAAEPVRAIEARVPVGVKTLPDGSAVYDFGQNASFVPRLRVNGLAGSVVRLTPAEVVNPDGTINRRTMGGPHRGSSWWQYTKATDGEETWFPEFYYLGSRYLHAECLPAAAGRPPPRIESLESVIVHSSAAPVGRFACSNERLNRIRDLVRWAQRSNMVSILTDCPHREKLGWIEQFHLNGPAIRYEFDVARLYTKAMRDMADAQTADGLVPNIAPEYTEFRGAFRNAAEWGAAFILVPWQQYLFAGDVELLRIHYEAMKRYFAFLEQRAVDGILSDGLGDWYDLDLARPGRAGLTPAPITATAFYYYDAHILAQVATLLGRSEEAQAFAAKAARLRERYNREFFHADTGTYATNSQCANALPLAMGIVEPAHRAPVLAALVRDVAQRGYATAGDIGFRYLLQALAMSGRSDVIYDLINQDEKPGYGYMLKKGETSLTEAWDANLGVSHNHFMLGQITEWFYKDLAGIDVDPADPGFKKIVLRPQPVGDLTWVEASYASIRGPIAVRWERAGDHFLLTAIIPANTTATVFVPARDGDAVLEGGAPAERRPGVTVLRREGDRMVYAIESGAYSFESRWQAPTP
jgi:alpha-L-rhamnosidase